LNNGPLTVLALLRAFRWRISFTWLLILIEVAFTALVLQRDNQAENAASIRMRMWVWGCVERA